MSLSVRSEQEGNATSLVVEGEVDVSNAGELRSALNQALDAGASSIEVDLSRVPYIDSTGIGVLVGAVHHAADRGVGLTVSRPQSNVARVLALLGVDGELHVVGA